MSVIEVGAFAGAIVAVIGLISKIVGLITSIQNLVHRLEILQTAVEDSKKEQQFLLNRMNEHERRIQMIEITMQEIHKDVSEIKGDIKEMMRLAIK